MNIYNKNINNVFYIFVASHLIIWTIVPSITNNNLPLDTIEALAWGSNLDWGFNKHPPASAFFLEVFYQIFGSQDWVFYFLSQIFVIISFYFVFKFAQEILRNSLALRKLPSTALKFAIERAILKEIRQPGFSCSNAD